MDEIGVVNSTIEKLHSIASGCWDPKDQPLAGSKHQRKCLKVPVAKTECGQNQFILWQIAIGMDVEMDVSQQQIIGKFSVLQKDRVLIRYSLGSMRL